MNIKWKTRLVVSVMMLLPVLASATPGSADTPVVLAAANTGGGAYADCMNGCWRSHRYCKKHQSGQMDCDHQLGQCIEWCESQHDPQGGGSGAMVLPAPRQRMAR